MLGPSDQSEQLLISASALICILLIASWLIRTCFRAKRKPWPLIAVGLYNILLLLLYILGVLIQITAEGFGFLPLMAFTLPMSLASGILGRLMDFVHGDAFVMTLLFPFLLLNVFCGAANSFGLYIVVRRWERSGTT